MGRNKVFDEALAPRVWMPIALATRGVSQAFKKTKEGLFILSTMLAFTERAELRELAQEVAGEICRRYPQLDRDECYKNVLKRLGALHERGQKAIIRFKKQIKNGLVK